MRAHANSGDEAALIGREKELQVLAGLLVEVREVPAAVALVGEPGIGKTRLLKALCEQADEAGFEILSGQGFELERDIPFGLIVDALDEPISHPRFESVRRITEERADELAAVLPSMATGEALATALPVERYRYHYAVRSVLERWALERPVLLCLDDVHWADPASIELISHLLRHRVPHSLLALAYRPGQAARPLLRAIERVDREGALQSLRLGPLSLAETAELLGGALEAPSVAALHQEGGGIPFYIQQLARSPRTAEPWRHIARGGPDTEVPASVRVAIANELDELPLVAQQLAHGAAVAGDVFDLDVAAEIADLDVEEGQVALDALTSADLLRTTEIPRRLRFRHPIVRRAMYDASSAGWRLAAHERAGEALTRRGAPVAVRAHHVERSAARGDEAAIALLTEAGLAAIAGAPGSAARWLEAALRLLPGNVEAGRRLSLQIRLAGALGVAGRLHDSRRLLSEALDGCPASERGEILAMLVQVEQGLGNSDAAGKLLADALSRAAPGGRDAAALTIELALNHLAAGSPDQASAAASDARERARTLGDDALDVTATVLLGLSANYRGELAEAQAWLAEAVPRLDATVDEDLPAYLDGLAHAVYAEASLERLQESAAHAQRGLDVSRATGYGLHVSHFLYGLALARMLQGRLSEARETADNAVEAALLLDNDQMLAATEGIRCWTASQQGDQRAALASGADAVRAAERAPSALLPWMAYACFGEALVEAGRPQDAREQLLAIGGPGLTRVQYDARSHWLKVLVVAELDCGNLEAAESVAATLESISSRFGLHRVIGDARYARACILLAQDELAAAAVTAGEAIDHYGTLGWRIWSARAQMLAARALAPLGKHDAAERGLEQARATLIDCGATRLTDQAAQQLRALGKRVTRRFETGTGPLSPREHEVAEAIALGYTNRQIAEELFVSQKTVETHITRILAKLSVSNRTGVAAAVGRAEV